MKSGEWTFFEKCVYVFGPYIVLTIVFGPFVFLGAAIPLFFLNYLIASGICAGIALILFITKMWTGASI